MSNIIAFPEKPVHVLVDEEDALYEKWKKERDLADATWEKVMAAREKAKAADRVHGQNYYYHSK